MDGEMHGLFVTCSSLEPRLQMSLVVGHKGIDQMTDIETHSIPVGFVIWGCVLASAARVNPSINLRMI
jgi:hypothetical protein